MILVRKLCGSVRNHKNGWAYLKENNIYRFLKIYVNELTAEDVSDTAILLQVFYRRTI